MSSASAQTEELIKEKAKVLIFQKGYLNATTQEIADEAGVNRALIHYYFRSREQMMEILLEEALNEKKMKVTESLSGNKPFRVKIANYIDVVVNLGLTYPYFTNFVISEINRHPDKEKLFCSKHKAKTVDLIRDQLEAEIKNGKLAPIPAEDFMVNLVSLCNYPLLAKPILKTIHGMTDEAYYDFLRERKRTIFITVFGEEPPQSVFTSVN